MSAVELRREGGSLVAYCGDCGWRMIGTTAKIELLIKTGEFDAVDSFCTKCGAKARIKLQITKAP